MNIDRIKDELNKRVNQKLIDKATSCAEPALDIIKRWEVIQEEFYRLVKEEKHDATQDDINVVYDILRDDIFALSRSLVR